MTHTCENGEWIRRLGGTEETEPVPTDSALWKDSPCKACGFLTVKPETGLRLICLDPAEPTTNDEGKLQVKDNF